MWFLLITCWKHHHFCVECDTLSVYRHTSCTRWGWQRRTHTHRVFLIVDLSVYRHTPCTRWGWQRWTHTHRVFLIVHLSVYRHTPGTMWAETDAHTLSISDCWPFCVQTHHVSCGQRLMHTHRAFLIVDLFVYRHTPCTRWGGQRLTHNHTLFLIVDLSMYRNTPCTRWGRQRWMHT